MAVSTEPSIENQTKYTLLHFYKSVTRGLGNVFPSVNQPFSRAQTRLLELMQHSQPPGIGHFPHLHE